MPMQSMIDQADDDLLLHESTKRRAGYAEMPYIQIQSNELWIRLKVCLDTNYFVETKKLLLKVL